MQPSDIKIDNEIKRLVNLIQHHNRCYFQKGIAEISDYEYDKLLERLHQLESDYPYLKHVSSPTDEIGERPAKGFVAIYHQTPMLSLAKTYLEEEVAQFVERIQRVVSHDWIDFICECKIDGIALSIVYEKGSLVRVVTRGDGEKGDNITRNALDFLQLPEKIEDPQYHNFEIRGEACMHKDVFAACNHARQAQGEPLWANPRNITAGTLKALDANVSTERRLAFYGYSFHAHQSPCTTQADALALLRKLGFAVMPTHKVCHTVSDIMDFIHYWHNRKDDLPMEIDGIVIKLNNLYQQQLMGTTSKSPRWAIAYKYQPDMVTSTLQSVDFQVGRTGAITPIAHFKPIVLAGTTVRRASLYNADALAKRDLHIGDTVFIEKGGEIIPKVVGVDVTRRPQKSQPITFPDRCPACHAVLHREAQQVAYYCANKQQCLPQLKNTLLHFAHRKAMDIDTLGPKTIDALFKANLVQTPADLYKLRYDQVVALEGFQALSTEKLLASIQSSKDKSFDKVLFALGIKHIGETIAKKLALYFKSMHQLQQANRIDLLQVSDIGDTIAQSIEAYMQDDYQQAIRIDLQAAGLHFSLPEAKVPATPLPLSGKTMVISGRFEQFTREELIKFIQEAGGTVLPAISTKVSYLVAGIKPGPLKLAKAMALSIPILNEKDILHMIQL